MQTAYIEHMESNRDGYIKIGAWQIGWTSQTAHQVTGIASVHGNARYQKVTSNCGQNFNPGRKIDPQNAPEGISVCSKCLEGPKAAKAPKTASKICPQCEFPHRAKTELCSGCIEINSWKVN